MLESAYSINEKPAHIAWEGSSNPVVLGNFDRNTRILPHLVPRTEYPTKYRRPSEGRRDSFGGGLPCSSIVNWNSVSCIVRFQLRATFRAISRRYPLTGDCFDGGHPIAMGCVSQGAAPEARCRQQLQLSGWVRVPLPRATFKAVPIGRCL